MFQLPQIGNLAIPNPWTPIEIYTTQLDKGTGTASSGLYLASFNPLNILNKGK